MTKTIRILLACLSFVAVLAFAQFAIAGVPGVPRVQGVTAGDPVIVSGSVTSTISGVTLGQKTSANSLPVVPASDYAPGNSTVGPTAISVACTDANINACGANSTVSLAVNGQGYASLKVVNSTATYQLKADYSIDGGTTWEAGSLVNATGVVTSSTSYSASSATAVYGLMAPKGGVSHWRARAGVSITNTFTAYLTAGYMAPAPSLVTQPVSGTVAATQSGAWSLSANQSVNVAQINGVAASMGNGASGTGVQRVTLASDSTGQVALAAGTSVTSTISGAAVLANDTTAFGNGLPTLPGIAKTSPTAVTAGRAQALQQRASDGRLFSASADDLSIYTTTATSTTATALAQVIAASGSNKTYIVNWKCSGSAASTATTDQQCLLKTGTGTNCGTGTALLDGCFQPATGGCNGGQIVAAASQAVCFIHAAAGTKLVSITYYQGP